MDKKLVQHTNDDIKNFTRLVYNETLHKNPTHVLACARGGLVLATYIAYYLDIPMMITNYSSPKGKGQHTNDEDMIQLMVDGDNPADEKSVILVVDDIADSGHTLNYIKLFLQQFGKVDEVITCALDFRDGGIKPDLFGTKIDKNDDVVYPWVFDLEEQDDV